MRTRPAKKPPPPLPALLPAAAATTATPLPPPFLGTVYLSRHLFCACSSRGRSLGRSLLKKRGYREACAKPIPLSSESDFQSALCSRGGTEREGRTQLRKGHGTNESSSSSSSVCVGSARRQQRVLCEPFSYLCGERDGIYVHVPGSRLGIITQKEKQE